MVNYMSAVCLACMVMCVTAQAGFNGCPYQLEQCHRMTKEFDQRINRLEATMALSEGRQEAITTEFKREMTVLSVDVDATKIVTNALVEDNVNIQGRIRVLQGVDGDVRNLVKRVSQIHEDVSGTVNEMKGRLNSFSANFNQQSDAQRSVSVLMSTQMNENKKTLTTISHLINNDQAKMTRLENKISGLETELQQTTGGGQGAELFGELGTRLDALQAGYDTRLSNLEKDIKEIKQILQKK